MEIRDGIENMNGATHEVMNETTGMQSPGEGVATDNILANQIECHMALVACSHLSYLALT